MEKRGVALRNLLFALGFSEGPDFTRHDCVWSKRCGHII